MEGGNEAIETGYREATGSSVRGTWRGQATCDCFGLHGQEEDDFADGLLVTGIVQLLTLIPTCSQGSN